MAISTNQKPTIYRNFYENTGPEDQECYVQPIILTQANFIFSTAVFTGEHACVYSHWETLILGADVA